ncbi:MAG: LysM peptidoglycan-binding domain-containing protein [Candidatus Marinimicrobia bacterium]|nr:LysM peptidoglycan-binding domain-containing protein [Candidatus Neomarinimicrobiota bacterium]
MKTFSKLILSICVPVFVFAHAYATHEVLDDPIEKPVVAVESVDSVYTDTTVLAETFYEADRFEALFNEAKIHFANALIAEHFADTFEVQLQLKLTFEALSDIEVFNNLDPIQYEEMTHFTERLIHDFHDFAPEAVSLHDQFSVSDLRESMEYLAEDMNIENFKVIDDRDGHIPIISNSRVESLIRFFQNQGRESFQAWLNRMGEYEILFKQILKQYDLPEELIYLSMIESGFKTNAYSYARAMGLWQFMYSTGKLYGLKRDYWVDERRDPVKATDAAARHLKDLYNEFGDWYLVMAAYNAGSGRIHRAIQRDRTRDFWKMYSLPKQTRNYVPTFLAAAIISRDPQAYGFTVPQTQPNYWTYDTLSIDKSVELESIARVAGIKYQELKELNPDLRRHSTPNYSYTIRLPKGKRETVSNALESFNTVHTVQYSTHVVRRGDTLTRISRLYNVPIRDIMTANRLRNNQPIIIGQRLTIPNPGYSETVASSQSLPDYSSNNEKIIYTVRKNDTLGHIAERYGTRASNIRHWNGLRYGQYIYPGQKLVLWIPRSNIARAGSDIYTVQRGDSLHRISRKTGVSVNRLKQLNPGINPSRIYPGDKIKLR